MKNILRFLVLMIAIHISTYLLIAQWVQTSGPNGGDVRSLAVNRTNIFAGTIDSGLFLSTNDGASWTAVNSGLTNTNIYRLAVSDTILLAGTGNGIFLSTNNGLNWTVTRLLNGFVYALAIHGYNIFEGRFGGAIRSTDYGASWTSVSSGLPNKNVQSLAIMGTNLFAGTQGDGVWRRPLSEMIITSIIPFTNENPQQVFLDQNYPNPFNPSTTFSFSLRSLSYVSLNIFDLMGTNVTTLISKELSAGNHSLRWDASSVSSGVYFYRLQADSFSETKNLFYCDEAITHNHRTKRRVTYLLSPRQEILCSHQ